MVIYIITTIWLCLEMHAVTRMADLTKFRQTERMFMDSAILANFSQILQSEIGLSDLTIWRMFAIFVTVCISGHTSLYHHFSFLSSVSPLYLYCQHLKTLTPIIDQDKISPYINNIYQAEK